MTDKVTLTKEQIEKFRALRNECDDETQPYFDELIALALRGLETKARAIEEAETDQQIIGFTDDERIGIMNYISGPAADDTEAYALWVWDDELLADSDPDPRPQKFIYLSALRSQP